MLTCKLGCCPEAGTPGGYDKVLGSLATLFAESAYYFQRLLLRRYEKLKALMILLERVVIWLRICSLCHLYFTYFGVNEGRSVVIHHTDTHAHTHT